MAYYLQMKREERLNKLFRAIAAGSVAMGGAACSDDGYDLNESLCDGDSFVFEEALFEGASLNYFEVEKNYYYANPETGELDGSEPPRTVRTTLGETCADTPDKDACESDLEAIKADKEGFPRVRVWPDEAPSYFLERRYYYTRGDEVGAIRSGEDLLKLIVPINTAKAAAALLVFSEETRALGSPECGMPSARFLPEGIVVRLRTDWKCVDSYTDKEHFILVRPEGGIEHLEENVLGEEIVGCVVGRLTDGVRIAFDPAKMSVADHLAEMAALEAAAVYAFRRLADEMRSLGAPESMVERALEAADDEVRHAVMVGLEARRRGKVPQAIKVDELPARPILEISLENAREGMVRETYGALAAHYHALSAKDPRLARLFARLAEDETRHAALSLDYGDFLDEKLSDEERAQVEEARLEAVRSLYAELGNELEDEVHEELGWPRPEIARALVREAFPQAWS